MTDVETKKYADNGLFELTEEIKSVIDDMDPKWLKFANLMLDASDSRSAAVRYQEAGYKAKISSATVNASKLLSKPIVKRYMRLARAEIAKGQLMSVHEIALHIQKQAMCDITQFIDWRVVLVDQAGKPVDLDEDGEPLVADDVASQVFIPYIKKNAAALPPHVRQMIKSVQLTNTGPKVEIVDQTKLMDMLIKIIGGYAPEKHDLNHSGSGAVQDININFIDGPGKEFYDNQKSA